MIVDLEVNNSLTLHQLTFLLIINIFLCHSDEWILFRLLDLTVDVLHSARIQQYPMSGPREI